MFTKVPVKWFCHFLSTNMLLYIAAVPVSYAGAHYLYMSEGHGSR